MAKDYIKRLFYRKETNFSFEKYVTKNNQTFNVIENYIATIYEEDKVRQLLDNINSPNKKFKTVVNIGRSSHSNSFKIASTHLSTVKSSLLPETYPSPGRYGRRQ